MDIFKSEAVNLADCRLFFVANIGTKSEAEAAPK